jgi:hypothetical protein
MNKIPSNSGACCLPSVDGITYLQVGVQGRTVGMRGLDTVFRQLLAMGRIPEEATDAELLGMARQSNYIPRREETEVDYASALRRAYVAFFSRQKSKE